MIIYKNYLFNFAQINTHFYETYAAKYLLYISGFVEHINKLPPSEKKRHSGQFATLRQKKKNEIMNIQCTKQHPDFYRDKPHKPTHNRSLQKSCFLADTSTDICIFGIFNLRTYRL